ncbi:MAG TPA: hypothetical protein VL137_14235 [Polyangiaceae bacterium]|jgi:hypothetical protein|nr:hypothetical protein [Polyangiaceae bacterium]
MAQIRNRSFYNVVLAAALALGAGAALLHTAPAYAADDEGSDSGACTAKKFNYPSVEKACKDGGRKAAKKLMKEASKKYKADGKDWKCNHCHKDLKAYELTDNAVKDLKPYI